MSIGKTTLRVLGCGLALTALGGLSGCGGGGGDGSAPQALTLSSVSAQTPAPGGGVQTVTSSALLVGQKPVTGPTVYEAYPTDPANPGIPNGVPIPNPPGNAQLSVAPPVFSIPGGGVQSFLELDFGTMVRASTIKSAAGGIQDGITLFWIQGATPPTQDNGVVRLLVDTTGVIDPSNVVTDDKAPARLRLYYSADGSLATPDALPVGDYLLRINANLLSSDGLGLVNGNTSSGVASGIAKLMPSWGFSIGPNATALDWAGPAEGVTVSGISANNATGVPVNSEIVLNFADAVDFPSLVGGANNLTTRDPFISVPFLPFLPGGNGVYEGGGGDDTPATNGNVPFTYGLPTDVSTGVLQPLPLNLGYVVYMPDPRLNPTQVRIRFVDVSTLVGIENTVIGQFQNYASNPDKFPIRSSNPALLNLTTGLTPLLTLPAASVVPGSYRNALNQVGNSVLTLNILAGATDRAANGALPRTVAFTWAVGPALARNPVSGDAVYVGIQTGGAPPEDKPGVGVVDTAALNGQPNVGCSQIPTAFGGLLGGNMSFRPNRLANPAVLGQPLDIDVGLTLNLGYPFPDAPRGGLVPGVPDGQNTVGPLGIFLCVGLSLAPPPQPYGNRLYVIDGTSSEVKVFNSYDFSLITTIPGVASPAG
ncbi:MAG TPA: hypothetical protein VEI02_02730, partial [Planctomycetota bacterium]|nr:hypothetical protein [Planctomycetota bacterium]